MMMSCVKRDLQRHVQTVQIICGKLLWLTPVPAITKQTQLLKLLTMRCKSSQEIHIKADSVFGIAAVVVLRKYRFVLVR